MSTVRRAVEADAEAIGAVHVAAARAAYRGMMPDEYLDSQDAQGRSRRWREALIAGGGRGVAVTPEGAVVVLVAEEEDGQIVGIAAIGPDRMEPDAALGELQMINVSPRLWGRGVAKRLLAEAERELRGMGYDEAVLWVLDSNVRARRFYEREGWSADGAVKKDERRGFTLRQARYRRRLE